MIITILDSALYDIVANPIVLVFGEAEGVGGCLVLEVALGEVDLSGCAVVVDAYSESAVDGAFGVLLGAACAEGEFDFGEAVEGQAAAVRVGLALFKPTGDGGAVGVGMDGDAVAVGGLG